MGFGVVGSGVGLRGLGFGVRGRGWGLRVGTCLGGGLVVLKPKVCLLYPVLDIAVKREGRGLVGAPEFGCIIDGRIGHRALRRCEGERRVEDDMCQLFVPMHLNKVSSR